MTVIASDLCLSSWMFHSSFWSLASLMKPEVSKKHGVEVPAPGAVSINQSCTFFFLSFCLLKGTFKKTRSGKIVQYDNKGKKMGVYKLNNGSLVRVK